MSNFELNLNTIPPAPPAEETRAEETHTEEPILEQGTQTEQASQGTQPDTFFEEMNKRFGTQFKAEDEVRSIFDLPKKVSEYESKLRESESLAKSVDDYKKKIDELEGSQDPSRIFSSPEVYKAALLEDQLRNKFPSGNHNLLREIAFRNLDDMNDLEVLMKDKALTAPKAIKEENLRAIVLKKYGVEPGAPPEEWGEMVKDEMLLDAATARLRLNELKQSVKLPEIPTREQRQQTEAQARAEREKTLEPMRTTFTQFDKFSHPGIPGFEADVTGEYKSKLDSIFKGYFGDSGIPPTKENLETAVEFRNAFFVYEHLPKLREIWLKEGRTEIQKKTDEELNNTEPPNTTTATDQTEVKNYRGLSDFVRGQTGR